MYKNLIYYLAIAVFGISCAKKQGAENLAYVNSDFNFDWQFKLVDSTATPTDWRTISLPHDWSVEASFDSIYGEGATEYLPGDKGIYRKKFPLAIDKDQTAYLLFYRVYNNARLSIKLYSYR